MQKHKSERSAFRIIIERIVHNRSLQTQLCVVPLGTCAFLWPSIINGYPLVYFDTLGYLRVACSMDFEHYFRGIGYPIWLFLTGIQLSGWLPVVAQAAMNAALLCAVAQLVLGNGWRRIWAILTAVLGTALLSAGPMYASWLMADALTSWMFLGLCIWLLGTRRQSRIVGMLLTIASALSHNSHLPILITCALMLGAITFIFHDKVWTCSRRSILGIILIAALLFPMNWVLGKAVNYGGTRWSLFLFNSFIGKGVIVETLDCYCFNADWDSCKLKQEFVDISKQRDPDWFLWKLDSPIHRLGWTQNSHEPKDILWHAFRCCLKRIVIGTLTGAWKQFWRVDSNKEIYGAAAKKVRATIAKILPDELAQFEASKQANPIFIYNKSVKTVLIPYNERGIYVLIYCLGLVLMLVAWRRKQKRLVTLFLLLQAILISNSFVCSFASTLHGRLQGRIAWLTVFCVLLGILALVRKEPAEGEHGLSK